MHVENDVVIQGIPALSGNSSISEKKFVEMLFVDELNVWKFSTTMERVILIRVGKNNGIFGTQRSLQFLIHELLNYHLCKHYPSFDLLLQDSVQDKPLNGGLCYEHQYKTIS